MIIRAAPILAGIFVGGAATRMGGIAKGLLPTHGGMTIVARLRGILDELGIPVLLVGNSPHYAATGIDRLSDEIEGIGPLGGLVALLRRAGRGRALALACDMPFVAPSLLSRLLAHPDAPAVAPRHGGVWEPLCARYDAGRVLPSALAHAASTELSLQKLLDAVGAAELPARPGDPTELCDWDTPSDVLRAQGPS